MLRIEKNELFEWFNISNFIRYIIVMKIICYQWNFFLWQSSIWPFKNIVSKISSAASAAVIALLSGCYLSTNTFQQQQQKKLKNTFISISSIITIKHSPKKNHLPNVSWLKSIDHFFLFLSMLPFSCFHIFFWNFKMFLLLKQKYFIHLSNHLYKWPYKHFHTYFKSKRPTD